MSIATRTREGAKPMGFDHVKNIMGHRVVVGGIFQEQRSSTSRNEK